MANMDDSLSYIIGEPLPGPFQSCWEYFENAVSKHPDSLAVVATHQVADLYGMNSQPLDTDAYAKAPYLRWTYHELRTAVDTLVRALSARGVHAGMPIFTFLPNGAEFLSVYWASNALGCTLVPINIRNLANAKEVSHMMKVAFKGCSSESSVVFADGPVTAAKLDNFDVLASALKIVVHESDLKHWTAFGSLMTRSVKGGEHVTQSTSLQDEEKDSVVLFTSGTTNLPKGCHWHHHQLGAFLACREAGGPLFRITNGDVFASLVPNNHAMGCFLTMIALCTGATLLYPGPSFEPMSFLTAARAERCTHTVAVPTMIYALLLAKSAQGIKLEYLNTVLLGGAALTPEILRLCTEELGAKAVENAYGLTEGVICFSGRQTPAALSNGSNIAIGRGVPGSRLKVCAAGSKTPVPRGEVGELHGTSPMVLKSYIGQSSDDFYQEDGLHWMATGDQAVIEKDGRIYVSGRYKEMIIRGGENLSPAAIESCIGQQLPQFRDHQVQVVGAADEIAGEVPVALVARPVDAEAIKQIKDAIVSNMGKMYSLDDVIYIEDLGLKDYPRTMAGKIQKNKLTDLVRQYRERSEATNGYVASQLTEQVTQIWARMVGVNAKDISSTTDLAELGDSITLMRVKDRIYKQTGVNLTVQEILEARTIGKMIGIMQTRAAADVSSDSAQFAAPDHPPTIDEMVYALDDPEIFEASKEVITKALPSGLSWDDVRDVMPAYDFTEVLARNGTLDRWCFKIALLARNSSVKSLRAAVSKTIANNPMQSSFIVWDDDKLGDDLALQFTVDPKPELIDSLVEDRGTLSTIDELKKTALDMCMVQGATYPGPLCRAYLYYVEETQCAGIIYNIHHAVTDATFAQLIFEDLDLALGDTPLKPHVPYKLYCDHFYTLRTSPAARAATMYHVRKLKGLAQHKEHYFPPMDRALQIEDAKPDGYVHTFSADRVHRLCQQHPQIAPSLVIKAATALFLLRVTNHTHAIFSHVESGRDRFPFITNAAAEAMKTPATDVGGQLFQSVLNLVSLSAGETTLSFLTRLQEEQKSQTKYASAPWREIMRGLDADSAALFPIFATDCIFNWLGSNIQGANAYTNMEIVDAPIRRDVTKFVNNASLVRETAGDKIMLHLRGSVWAIEDLRGFAEVIEATTIWLTENLDRPIEEFREGMRKHD
ncbi:acetyl-CoA synthetase-like protein [Rhizodiscina lignyota]|uniref:Acetyl-CoA synthetase-like protein n=1 Tax=Rhizodiscina lignyota TaxID=1504668 RepID=A0A9P4MDJ5_9PEZI|nr:acetyl-CoA synthetase-like protein [Rhizodiscina lignyota]